ncbi:MAG: hypothetical protein MI864_07610 [Pseudomonadales bacterium]|nr:hypothetical protein [Pseudomonadales bacterium]
MQLATVKLALEIARYYPSGDNSQCFRFRFNQSRLHVDYHAEHARHALVYDSSMVLITLGGLAEYLRNAFAQVGWCVHFQFNLACFHHDRDSRSVVVLSFSPLQTAIEGHFFDAATLKQRVTDRRVFLPVHSEALSDLLDEQQFEYIDCQVRPRLSDTTLRFFARCESQVWHTQHVVRSILQHIQFAEGKPETGLPWRNLGVSKTEIMPIRLAKRLPWVARVLEMLGMSWVMFRSQFLLWQSSACGLVFSYRSGLSEEQRVRGAMEMMRVILTLTRAGYALQPSTLSTEVLNIDFKPDRNLTTEAGFDADALLHQCGDVRAELGMPQREIAWLFRLGRPVTPFPEQSRTHRLPVSVLLESSL